MSELTILAGSRIRLARKQAEWTLLNLATATGLSVSHLSEVERGCSPITLALLEEIGTALCLSPLWFLDLDDAEQERNRRAYYQRMLVQIGALVTESRAAQTA